MAVEESLDEKLAPGDFVTDIRWAARAVFDQPSVALVSIGLWVLPMLLPRVPQPGSPAFIVVAIFSVLSPLFMSGWFGAERMFFLRRWEGKTVALSELLASVSFFVGRFLRLSLLVGVAVIPLFVVADHLGGRYDSAATETARVTARRISTLTIMVPLDFALTFVTSALVFTTHSARQALRIGLAMIRQTWPRSGLYVLCPALALNMLNVVYRPHILVVSVVTTAGLGLLALLAKGAIAAFYLRERPVSRDAVAQID